jgi:hypothetical protein
MCSSCGIDTKGNYIMDIKDSLFCIACIEHMIEEREGEEE